MTSTKKILCGIDRPTTFTGDTGIRYVEYVEVGTASLRNSIGLLRPRRPCATSKSVFAEGEGIELLKLNCALDILWLIRADSISGLLVGLMA